MFTTICHSMWSSGISSGCCVRCTLCQEILSKTSTLVQTLRLCRCRTAHRGSRGVVYSFLTTALEGVRGQNHAQAALYPRERRGTHCTLNGSQGRSGQVRKISPPPGFDPRTVQSVASRYTDYATRPKSGDVMYNKT